jgi:hypothetical protein
MDFPKYSFILQRAEPTARQKAERLETSMLDVPQVDCPVEHYFAPGMWARQITIPKGVVLVGAIHKTDNLAVLSKGTIMLVTNDQPVELIAPCTVLVKAGQKNAAVAVEEAVWTNFFPNPDNETNINNLVEKFSESKACELIGGSTNPQLIANKLAELEH